MEPGEFYEIAEELLKNINKFQREEGIARTIIGRYYYYLYLEIRETIVSVDENMKSELKGEKVTDVHKKVRNYLGRIYYQAKKDSSVYGFRYDEIESIRILKNSLSILLKMRKDSDYKLNLIITQKDAEKAKAEADQVRENNCVDIFRRILHAILKSSND